MILETLVFRCLVQGTKFQDAGKTISLRVASGETVLFFKIDDDTKKNCLRIDGECCDCLVFFVSAGIRVFCLAELKGKNTNHGVRQVINTYEQLTRAFSHSRDIITQHIRSCPVCGPHANNCAYCRNMYSNFRWKAIIHQQGSSPNMLSQQLAREMVSRFGRHGEGYEISHQEDIGHLLHS